MNKYYKPLEECCNILKQTEGVNYIITCADAGDEEAEQSLGGCGWNVEDDSEPNFFSMVGNLIEQYFNANEIPYTEQLKLIRNFSSELVENITNKKGGE